MDFSPAGYRSLGSATPDHSSVAASTPKIRETYLTQLRRCLPEEPAEIHNLKILTNGHRPSMKTGRVNNALRDKTAA